jgi:hypothetical protein
MSKWYRIPPTIAINDAEYRANMQGINIVFGAVLAFVLARIEGLPPLDFAFVLIACATAVVLILYLASTEYLLFYGLSVVAAIMLLPVVIERAGIPPIPDLQPTLAAWTVMVLVVELSPRRGPAPTEPKDDTP